MKKNYQGALAVLAILALVIPQVAFGAWYNPLSWSIFSRFKQVMHRPFQQKIPPSAHTATSAPKSDVSTTAALQDAARGVNNQTEEIEKLKKEVSELKKRTNSIANSPQPSAPPAVVPRDQPDVQAPNPTDSSPSSNISWVDLENRYFVEANQKGYNSIYIDSPWGERRYYRLENGAWIRKATSAEAQQSQQSTQRQTQQQSTQDQAKALELKSLEDQYKELQKQLDALTTEQAALPCLSFVTGEMASRCNRLSLQISAISNNQLTIVEKQALLQGIYLPPPIPPTPTHSSIQCSWTNGGTVWNCSSATPGATGASTQCSWISGGTVWYCH